MTGARPRPIVAIDGPAGAGKSTVAVRVARDLGFVLVDTGALYRGVALAARERGIDWDDADALAELARSLELSFVSDPNGTPRLQLDGRDRADDIRTPEISRGASAVSRHAGVREALLGVQRALGSQGGLVLEGRDIGTVVFPDAEAKVFLTASPEARARRRVGDLAARGIEADYEQTLAEVMARDAQDSSRAVAPLKPAADSTQLDTTDLDFEAVVARVLAIARAAGA